MSFFSSSDTRRGFTMIELLVAATILAVLTTIGVVSFQQANRKARDGKRMADINQVRSGLELYRSANLTTGYPTGVYSAMIGTLRTAGYISDPLPADPKAGWTYSYNMNNGSYCLCAQLEMPTGNANNNTSPPNCSSGISNGTHYCVGNP